jgi:hypothetical protein
MEPGVAVGPFDLREHCFNRVELWAVAYVEYRGNAKFFVHLSHLCALVDRELVHE